MKQNKYDKLFMVLLIVGILLMGYGMFSQASTSIMIDADGFSFMR